MELIYKIKFHLKRIIKSFKKQTEYYIHKSVIIWGRENLLLSKNTQLYEYVIIRAKGKSKVKIGSNTQVGPFTVIFVGSGVTIGNDVLIAPHCVIAGGNHEYRQIGKPMMFAGDFSKGPIIIENDVWIGANCVILDGIKIAKGAVIAANSVVTKNIAEYDIVAGNPATIISNRKQKYDTKNI